MTDPTRRAVELTYEALDSLTASIELTRANPSSAGDGGIPAFEAVLAGISAYLIDPVAVSGTLEGVSGEQKPAAALLLEATDRVRDLALRRLAQAAGTRDAKTSLEGIASMISFALDSAASSNDA